jgi:hypothetical protein
VGYRYLTTDAFHINFIRWAVPDYIEQVRVISEYPGLEIIHRLLGAAMLVAGMILFSEQLRRGRPGVHRWTGRLFIASGLLVSLTGLAMGIFFPFAGGIETAIVFLIALAEIFMLARAYFYARRRRFKLHREWAIRAVALPFFVAVQRPIHALLVATLGWEAREAFVIAAFASVMLVLCSAEWWVNATRISTSHNSQNEVEKLRAFK